MGSASSSATPEQDVGDIPPIRAPMDSPAPGVEPLELRRRRLSVENQATKDAMGAHAKGGKGRRRRLSIISTSPSVKPRAKLEPNTPEFASPTTPTPTYGWGDAGLGNGAEAVGGTCKSLPIVWGAVSRPGNDPMKRPKENQDTYCVFDEFAGRERDLCVCVFDGHGPNGAEASEYIRSHLYKGWAQSGIGTVESEEDVRRVLHQGCVETNAQLAMSNIDVYVSGTTGILGLLRDDTLFVANVGDSRAVLGRVDEAGEGLKAVELSDDHKPDRPDEEARIVGAGGRVFEWGVPRVWRKNIDMPGLAMSRSFGDIAAESIGVFAEPEITVTKLGDRDRELVCFLIFASDGVWEFLSSQDVVDIIAERFCESKEEDFAVAVRDAGQAVEACALAARRSIKKWGEQEDVVDDITCVVLFMELGKNRSLGFNPPSGEGDEGAAAVPEKEKEEEPKDAADETGAAPAPAPAPATAPDDGAGVGGPAESG